MTAMSARTRSDILAAASGMTAAQAAKRMLFGVKRYPDEKFDSRRGDVKRMSRAALVSIVEAAVECARDEDADELKILRLENEALRADLQEIADVAANRGTHGAR